MSSVEWSMLIALSILWGGSFFFNEVALAEIPVMTLAFLRVAIAAIVLTLFLHMWGERLPASGSIWSAFLAMGLLNNVLPFTLILAGQQHIASGVASILNAATPLFTVVLAHFLTRDERMTPHKVMGVLIGFAGVAAMIGSDAVRDLGRDVVAQTLCLAGALSYAFAGIFGRRFRSLEVTPMATATGQVIASSVLLMPLMLITDRPWTLPVPGGAAIGSVIGVATLSTALAYILYFRILATAGATNLLLVTLLIPVSAILLGALVLGEALHPHHVAGMVLIAVGLAVIDGRLGRRFVSFRQRTDVAKKI